MPPAPARRALFDSVAVLTVLVAAAVALAGPAVATPLTPVSSSHAPSPRASVTTERDDAAAGWLSTQLVDGNHIETVFDLNGDGIITDDERFPDYGLTADTVVALAAAGVGADPANAATDYLAGNIEAYTGGDGQLYAGALGKSLLVTAVTRRDGTDFGGVDLVDRLLRTETPSGRYSDISPFGDFSNTIGQSLAVLGLQRVAPAELTPSAGAFLTSQQCLDGGPNDGNVPVTIDAEPCADSALSVDATSFAAQALAAAGQDLAAQAALDFLTAVQDDDGGFSDLGAANANSTGLATQALAAGGRRAAARAAHDWLVQYQIGCAAPVDQQGAIAFTADENGTPLFDDRAVRATAQATPGLAAVGLQSVTLSGATAQAPRLDCAGPTPSPSPTPTPSPTATPTPTSPAPTSSSPTPPPTSGPGGPSATRPGLPNTGVDILPVLGFGSGSLLLGVGLLLAGRRRPGAHR